MDKKTELEIQVGCLLRGTVIEIRDLDHFKDLVNAFCEKIGEKDYSADDFITESKQYIEKNKKDKVVYQLLTFSTPYNMSVLNATISFTGKPPRPFTANGLFGHAHNFTEPEFSELGYTFYENIGTKESPLIHRVG